jgi:hypothetical protein
MTRTERIKIQLACANLRAIATRELLMAHDCQNGSDYVALWAAEALASLSTMLTERVE